MFFFFLPFVSKENKTNRYKEKITAITCLSCLDLLVVRKTIFSFFFKLSNHTITRWENLQRRAKWENEEIREWDLEIVVFVVLFLVSVLS